MAGGWQPPPERQVGQYTVQEAGRPRWPFAVIGALLLVVGVLLGVVLSQGSSTTHTRTVAAVAPSSTVATTTTALATPPTTAPAPTTQPTAPPATPHTEPTVRPLTTTPPSRPAPTAPPTTVDSESRPDGTAQGSGEGDAGGFTITGKAKIAYTWGENGGPQGWQDLNPTGCSFAGVVYGPNGAVIGGFNGSSGDGAGSTEVQITGTGKIGIIVNTAQCDDGPFEWNISVAD